METNGRPPFDAVVLVGHGTREAPGNEEFLRLVRDFAGEAAGARVRPAFIELAQPLVREALEAAVQEGARRIAVVPVIQFPAGHVKGDIPEAMEAVRGAHPGVSFLYAPPVGAHPLVFDILEERTAEAETQAPGVPRSESAVLLVGRGSSDPEANAELYRVARLYWERARFGSVEVCFIGVTSPDYPEGIRRCVALGARAVHVLPYFLFHGVLMTRLREMLDARFRPAHPDRLFTLGRPFGPHPKLRAIVRERLREARPFP